MVIFNDSQFKIIVLHSDYIVTDHVLHHVRTMPGVTFIDLVYRICLAEGISLPQIQLRNILFKEPVVTSEQYDKEVQIEMKREGAIAKVTARSRKVKNGQVLSEEWSENFQCEVHAVEATDARTIDLAKLKADAGQIVNMEEAYSYGAQIGLVHRDFMKLRGSVYVAGDYVLAELDLTALGQQFADHFYLHPAYLDGTLNVARIITLHDEALHLDKLFIPMYVGCFQAFERLAGTCYVHIRKKSVRLSPSKDISYADFEVYDRAGRLVASYDQFGAKQVRSEELIQALQRLENADPQPEQGQASKGIQEPMTLAPAESLKGVASSVTMEQHLRVLVGELLNKQPETVSPSAGFYDQGLDSSALLKLVQKLEKQLGQQLYPTLLFEYTNIRDLAGFLAEEYGASAIETVSAGSSDAMETVKNADAAKPAQEMVLSPAGSFEQDLREMIGSLLQKPSQNVELDAGFYDQGLDSSALLKLVQTLEAKLQTQLYPTLLFEYTNIRELADFLAREYGAKIERRTVNPSGNTPSLISDSGTQPKAANKTANDTLYLRRTWELAPLQNVGEVEGPVLVFDREEGLRDALQKQLRNGQVALVKPGTTFRDLGGLVYEIHPSNLSHYRELLKTLDQKGVKPQRLLHCWVQGPFSTEPDALALQQEQGFASLVLLTQVLMEQKPQHRVNLLYLYESAPEESRPHQAAVSGFCHTLAQENPKFLYKTLELCTETGTVTDFAQAAEIVCKEWQTEGEMEVRYQDGRRYRKRFVEVSPDQEAAGHLPLKRNGVYLITGGFGGLGLLFAKHLASKAPAKWVLVGRSPLDATKQALLQDLQGQGAEVLYVQADVTKRSEVERLVSSLKSRFGRIDGVLHSAGVLRDSFIRMKTPEEIEAVLATKIQAVVHLDEVLQQESLDFLVLFSSVAALIGNVGQADYAYGNAFLDHFAAWREEKRRQGERQGRTISINWPLWKDGGMQVDAQKEALIFEKTGIRSLSTEKGLQAFADAFRLQGTQVLVLEGVRERILQNLEVRSEVKAEVQTGSQHTTDEDIAIIGVSGRYPQSRNLDEFWNNLKNGRNCITEIPADRWDLHEYFDEDKNHLGKSYTKWGGFLEDIDKFDALFFHISPREAVLMDPQERLFMQTVWETLEDAGYTRDALSDSRVGVFVGVMWAQYQLLQHEVGGKTISPTSIYASVANRISYFFNFTGPSVAMDTMCSSSLTSLHFACESIRRGESELAIAGGVNLSIHPNKYVFLSTQRFASSDGTCKSFGDGGDGYVPGEGVGAVLLKPLSKAIADGDQIYAVIKATAINTGGKSSGYAVPSPVAQANVIADAIQKSGVDPTTISYVEAHGTGTALGDPIEITGLNKAFGHVRGKGQFCAIGSVKSNIGHLESAAGVAAITKVLLQMRHGQIVPSLHSETLNPKIDFANSPFYVQQELQEWNRPVVLDNGEKRVIPRRAGVSSFGAGGSNAHILLEEYQRPANENSVPKAPQIVVLSARSEDRLQESVMLLREHVQRLLAELPPYGHANSLRSLVYTLQTGREAMEARAAYVVDSLEQLAALLGTEGDGIYSGNTEDSQVTIDANQVRNALRSQDAHALARLWTQGASIDWHLLYGEEHPVRMSLPTYPFLRERYWVNEPKAWLTGAASQDTHAGTNVLASQALHPLVDANESTLEAQTFRKTLHADEFFLRDHVISGQKILPGAAYLELVRAAGVLAGARPVAEIKDVIWATPMVVQADPQNLYISFFPEQNDVSYEVYSISHEQKRVHSQGKISFAEQEGQPVAFEERYDLEAIKQRCTHRKQKSNVYQTFREAGFAFGRTFQVTDELFGGEREGLVKLSLPQEVRADFDRYVLHPSLLDGALRSIAAVGVEKAAPVLRLPFSLGNMRLGKPITEVCYAYAKAVTPLDAEVVRYEIAILNEAGEVLVRLQDFSTRVFKEQPVDLPESAAKDRMLYYTPTWHSAPLLAGANDDPSETILLFAEDETWLQRIGQQSVLVKPGKEFMALGEGRFQIDLTNADDYHRLLQELGAQNIRPTRIVHALSLGSAVSAAKAFEQLSERLENGLYSIFYLFQAITKAQADIKTRCLFFFPHNGQETVALHEAVAGFANSLTPVNHRFELVSIQLDNVSKQQDVLPSIVKTELAQQGNGTEIKYVNGERSLRTLAALDNNALPVKPAVPLRKKGVYLITGGAGGLGLIFAEYLAQHYQASLVLTGRSALSPEKMAQIEALKQYGADVTYLAGDISRAEDVSRIVTSTKSKYGALHGIFHCAGITGDKLVLDAVKADFEKVLGPKLDGTLHLDRVTAEEKLDLFVLFSSISALVGDFGGCSYAVGNAFLDRFAAWREERAAEQKRYGRTLSVNWPLWKGGGLELPAEEAEVYYEYSGMRPMTVEQGMAAFESLIAASFPQVVVINGNETKVNRVLKVKTATASLTEVEETDATNETVTEAYETNEADGDALFLAAETYLKQMLSGIINLPQDRIKSRVALEKYGIDSVMIMEINSRLEQDFASLSKTLLFEYGNLHDLAHYFAKHHADRIRELCGLEKVEAKPKPKAKPQTQQPLSAAQVAQSATEKPVKRNRFTVQAERSTQAESMAQKSAPSTVQDIAIIGVSGRYPQAGNLDEFWSQLKEGRDCITEIPAERWDYRHYFDPKKGVKGKTYSKWGGFITEADRFDSLFFNISPREADTLDPQERLFMQTAWHTIEDAGYTRNKLDKERVGVFVGVMFGLYQLFGVEETLKGNPLALSSMYSSVANRVSYFMNFNGPSLTIDTACSSSLEAIRQGCESIQRGVCDMAIAGGVNLSLHPQKYILLAQGHFLASDGRCRTFGDGGDGYVPGEGVGAVLLKRLDRAIEDGDQIYAVIKAATINHGGKTNGYSVPNPNAQANLISEALKKANIDARTVSYIEAHGTGTSLGDPIEVTGLTKAFREFTEETQFCALGSAKSNIGHLESAAGIAAVTKVLLQMKHKQLVPSLHSQTLNPNIDFASTPFYVQQELTDWARPVVRVNGQEIEMPRRAGISGFGAGGTNVHLLLEEYEPKTTASKTSANRKEQLLVLSARNEDRLVANAGQLLQFLRRALVPNTVLLVNAETLTAYVEKELQAQVASLLNIDADEIDSAEPLLEYGFDAVAMSEFCGRVQEVFSIEIETHLLAECQTLESLAKSLAANYGDRLAARYEPSASEIRTGAALESLDLADVAYTLQTGREEMDERLAIVASSLQDFCDKLESFLNGKNIPNVYRGNTKVRLESQGDLLDGEEGEDFLRKILERGKLGKLAKLWVFGTEIEWERLYTDEKQKRISLPGYSFAKTRHWFRTKDSQSEGKQAELTLHPLLDGVDVKKSLRQGIVFRKQLSAQDPLVAHAIVQGQRQFPNLAALEFAQAGALQMGEGTRYRQSDVVWLDPLTVGEEAIELHVLFQAQGDDRFTYEIQSQGITRIMGEIQQQVSAPEPILFPLDEALNRCGALYSGAEFYERLQSIGFAYGSTYQMIGEVRGGSSEILARVDVSKLPQNEREMYSLHPVWMASVMQALNVLFDQHQLMMVGSVDRLQPLPVQGFVHVEATETGHAQAVIVDETGRLCVRFNEMLLRASEQHDLGEQQVPEKLDAEPKVVMIAASQPVPAITEQSPQVEPAHMKAVEPEPVPNEEPVGLNAPVGLDEFERQDYIQETITDSVVQVLQMDRGDFDPNLPYIDFGVDSILAIEIVNRINETLKIEIRPTELFNYPTVTKMAAWIFAEYDATIPYPAPSKTQQSKPAEDSFDLELLKRLERGELTMDQVLRLQKEAR